jgi:hypothetical protein
MPIRSKQGKYMPADTIGRIPATLLLALALIHARSALAEKLTFNSGNRQVTLLELYTSQGCSSCPPAERWLNEYVYASGEYGERQRNYARAGKARSVYTPGLFANGREWRGWTLRVSPRASNREPGDLSVSVETGRVTATFDAATAPYELHLALLGLDINTRIERGENRGATLKQQFVVLAHASHVSGNGRWNVPLPQGGLTAPRYALAAWVSAPGNPAPLQATGGWLAAISER